MSSRRCWVAALMAMALATGCTPKIGGTARPAPLPPMLRIMLDGATLSKLLGQPFKNAPQFPPSYGGSEKFGTADESASPADCIGVVFMMQKIVYQSVPVKDAVRELWRNDGRSVKVDDVDEGVISFATAKDAAAAFERFSGQWQKCDGTTLSMDSVTSARNVISDVRLADSVVAASVLMHPHENSILTSIPMARALGVRGNYLVEVAVSFYGNDDPAARGSGDVNTSGVYLAHAMLDRLALT
jgi:hypothetical protein